MGLVSDKSPSSPPSLPPSKTPNPTLPDGGRRDGLAAGKPPPPPCRAQLGLWASAKKRKDSFVQLLFMTGILLLSMRSLGQKHRLNDLAGETAALRDEHRSLSEKMEANKQSLLREAALDKSGVSRLRRLFDPS